MPENKKYHSNEIKFMRLASGPGIATQTHRIDTDELKMSKTWIFAKDIYNCSFLFLAKFFVTRKTAGKFIFFQLNYSLKCLKPLNVCILRQFVDTMDLHLQSPDSN